MVRQTSIDAYNAIKNNGLLSHRRWQVYDILFRLGPLTGREVFNKIENGFTTHTAARLTELRNLGCISEIGRRICSVTGMEVILWDVTDRLPLKLEKPKRHKCPYCDGRGYFEETQTKMF